MARATWTWQRQVMSNWVYASDPGVIDWRSFAANPGQSTQRVVFRLAAQATAQATTTDQAAQVAGALIRAEVLDLSGGGNELIYGVTNMMAAAWSVIPYSPELGNTWAVVWTAPTIDIDFTYRKKAGDLPGTEVQLQLNVIYAPVPGSSYGGYIVPDHLRYDADCAVLVSQAAPTLP